jgi:hypothetical protein
MVTTLLVYSVRAFGRDHLGELYAVVSRGD